MKVAEKPRLSFVIGIAMAVITPSGVFGLSWMRSVPGPDMKPEAAAVISDAMADARLRDARWHAPRWVVRPGRAE